MVDITLTPLVGLPGSGKTTWAQEMIQRHLPGEVARLNRDELRAMLHSGAFAGALTEGQVLAIEKQAARILLSDRDVCRHVIIDDTNLRPTTLDMWRELATEAEAEFQVLSFLDVPVATCIERDARRAAPVGEQVIRELDEVLVHAARRWMAEL